MPLQIGATPDAGFDQPVAMLRDCHRRILRFAGLLGQVARDAQGYSLSKEQQSAVEAALRYFGTSGPLHNADEECSLFPRLRGRVSATVTATIARLEAEHREAEGLQRRIGQLFQHWIAEFGLDRSEEQELGEATERLESFYDEHIRIEEATVFAAAETILNREEQAEIGREFSGRRRLAR